MKLGTVGLQKNMENQETILKKFFPALKIVIVKLLNADLIYAFTGSFNHFLQGVLVYPKDLDIITTTSGAYVIDQLLNEYNTRPVKFEETQYLRSHYGCFLIEDSILEVMGNVENKVDTKWQKHIDWKYNMVNVKTQGLNVPCLSLEYELEIYKKLKLLDRVSLIEDRLNLNI